MRVACQCTRIAAPVTRRAKCDSISRPKRLDGRVTRQSWLPPPLQGDKGACCGDWHMRRRGREVEGGSLENCWAARSRGFESYRLRQVDTGAPAVGPFLVWAHRRDSNPRGPNSPAGCLSRSAQREAERVRAQASTANPTASARLTPGPQQWGPFLFAPHSSRGRWDKTPQGHRAELHILARPGIRTGVIASLAPQITTQPGRARNSGVFARKSHFMNGFRALLPQNRTL